ncbi:MAG: ABC transporter ATP-binding protein [Bacteroidetes bacterium]|nr:MAG: ABC transporter ATP-binding protein [Bacteroidota bacterium]
MADGTTHAPGAGRRRPGEPLIAVQGLTKRYREGEHEREVLRGVNLHIDAGELVVLLGRSGSGKSTFLNLISGIDLPTSGTITMGGTNLTALSEQERTLFRRQHIGFVFQAFNLIPTLTVAENVLLPLELNGRTGANEQRQALAYLAEVGLGDRAGSFPDRLSGGEQQRVAIARALAHDPLLILADEPTGNLDVRTAAQVMALLDRLVRQAGKTMLVVTHDPDLRALADRVLVLEEGRIVDAAATVA